MKECPLSTGEGIEEGRRKREEGKKRVHSSYREKRGRDSRSAVCGDEEYISCFSWGVYAARHELTTGVPAEGWNSRDGVGRKFSGRGSAMVVV